MSAGVGKPPLFLSFVLQVIALILLYIFRKCVGGSDIDWSVSVVYRHIRERPFAVASAYEVVES